MAREHGVDDATLARAVERRDGQGVVELGSLCGYYSLVSFTLNAFAVPLPPREVLGSVSYSLSCMGGLPPAGRSRMASTPSTVAMVA